MLLAIFKLEENNFPGISKGKILGILELINMLTANVREHVTLGPQIQSSSGGNPFGSDAKPFCGSCGMLT